MKLIAVVGNTGQFVKKVWNVAHVGGRVVFVFQEEVGFRLKERIIEIIHVILVRWDFRCEYMYIVLVTYVNNATCRII